MTDGLENLCLCSYVCVKYGISLQEKYKKKLNLWMKGERASKSWSKLVSPHWPQASLFIALTIKGDFIYVLRNYFFSEFFAGLKWTLKQQSKELHDFSPFDCSLSPCWSALSKHFYKFQMKKTKKQRNHSANWNLKYTAIHKCKCKYKYWCLSLSDLIWKTN